MKRKLFTLGALILMLAVNADSQTTPGGTPGNAGAPVAPNLPSIPQNQTQQQDYIKPRELHSAAATNQINPQTNLAPTSIPGATNRLYGTNSLSVSNNTAGVTQDQALTELDQRLLLRIRQSSPKLSPNGQWSTVNFHARNGVITTVGTVNSIEEDKEIISAIQEVPGVVRINDQLSVSARGRAVAGAAVTSEAAGAPGTAVESSTATNIEQRGVTTSTTRTGPADNKVNTGFTTQTSPYVTRPTGYYTSGVSTVTTATNQAVPGQTVPGAGAVVAPTSNPNATNRNYNNGVNPAVPRQ